MKITIGLGDRAHPKVELDLDVLLSTRMLLTADSGGGKTFALKRIIEQAFGKIQILVIDPEGEFSPLRERFDFVLVGKGGETPADTRSAKLVAQTLLKLRANAICDLYEMKPSERHIWVRDFCDGLLEAPKEHRHPCLVIVDEAHLFAPEHGKGESVAADAVIGLCTRGRKRLLVALFATQRLASLSKDASSMLLNRMVGGTFEDVNRKRASEVLGIAKEKKSLQDFYDEIKTLEPGYFFCLGRALCKERTLVHVGPIKTAHGQDALKYEITPPPPPDKVKALLPRLSDLPKQAEEKAKSEAEFRREIRELREQLRKQSAPAKAGVKSAPMPTIVASRAEKALRALLEEAMKVIVKIDAFGFEKAGLKQEDVEKAFTAAADQVMRLSKAAVERRNAEFERLKKEPNSLLERLKKALDKQDLQIGVQVKHNEPVTVTPKTFFLNERHELPISGKEQANGDLSGPERKILTALSQLRSIGKDVVPKAMAAAWAGYSPEGGAFGNPIGKLNSNGLVCYPQKGQVSLTVEGLSAIGEQPAPTTQEEIQQKILGILTGPERKILSALLAHRTDIISKNDLAAESGYAPVGGAFGNPMGALRTKGFLDYPSQGMVQAASWLFIE